LLKYSNGTFSYILASKTLYIGSYTFTTANSIKFVQLNLFSCCNILLKFVKYSQLIFNIEPYLNKGGKYARSAGVFCKVINIDLVNKYVRLKLTSGAIKIISIFCYCNLGRVSNMLHFKEFYSNAGLSRNIGFRPITRGIAKNPVDQPHGGRTKTNSPTLTP
jgi:large subunit ribosomal protein L2